MSKRDLVFRSPELEGRLRPTCEEVLKRFEVYDTRLLCFLDDEDAPEMTCDLGPLYCGVFGAVQGNRLHFPDYLLDLFADFSKVPRLRHYDYFVYVRDTTCKTVPGAVITLAHELTHCWQRHTATKVWLANSLLYWNLGDMDRIAHAMTNAWDIPIEHEAQLNSRRVAVELLGETVVDAHAASRIQDNHDPGKWRFFRSLSMSSTFDLLEATKPWVNQYRNKMQDLDQEIDYEVRPEHKIDFTQAEWWR
ncbi:MAG TPA: hypothetical protein VFQ41_08845 [Candidatus Angelobacter sp.]|nr:hypothetical protein [Candidatus Angelobacter sp.]